MGPRWEKSDIVVSLEKENIYIFFFKARRGSRRRDPSVLLYLWRHICEVGGDLPEVCDATRSLWLSGSITVGVGGAPKWHLRKGT